MRRDLGTSIRRGIVAKLVKNSSFETRLNALMTLTSIGLILVRARVRADDRYHGEFLDDKRLNNLITSSMEFVLALSPEGKRKEDYERYCLSERLSQNVGLREGLLHLINLKRGRDFPGLASVFLKLHIPED